MILEITRKRLFLFGSFIVVMLAIPITVYLSQQRQDQRSQASEVPDSTVVAVINGEQITKGDVRNVAEEQYKPEDVSAQALKTALMTIAERAILEYAASEYDIEIDQEWVDELTADGYSENEAYYQVLKNQVILKAVKSRSAYTIQFWNTPESGLNSLSQEEKSLSAKQLQDGIPALSEAETALSEKDVLEIGDNLLRKYPSLESVLAVNGYILYDLTESERIIAKRPQVYQLGDLGLDNESKSVLLGIEENGVGKVTGTETNRGGIVFKVISKNDTGAETYDVWYEAKKAELVDDLGIL